VAGDFNAKYPVWGDHREDLKGQALADMMASMDMVACNQGDKPTFCRTHQGGVSKSHIDITFVSARKHPNVRDWEVLEDYTGSLHNYIVYNFSSTRQTEKRQTETRWSWRKYDKKKLIEYINSNNREEGTDPVATYAALDRYLVAACDSCMPKGQYRRGKKPVYWWNNDIENLRNDCKKARRRSKRMRHKAVEVQERATLKTQKMHSERPSRTARSPAGASCATRWKKTPGVFHTIKENNRAKTYPRNFVTR